MPQLRNPGLYSVLIVVVAALLVVGLYFAGSADALKLGASLVMLVVTAFGAKSAVQTRGRKVRETHVTLNPNGAVSVAREKPQTWPGIPTPPTVDTTETVETSPHAPLSGVLFDAYVALSSVDDDRVRDALDPIWRALSKEQRATLDQRVATTDTKP